MTLNTEPYDPDDTRTVPPVKNYHPQVAERFNNADAASLDPLETYYHIGSMEENDVTVDTLVNGLVLTDGDVAYRMHDSAHETTAYAVYVGGVTVVLPWNERFRGPQAREKLETALETDSVSIQPVLRSDLHPDTLQLPGAVRQTDSHE